MNGRIIAATGIGLAGAVCAAALADDWNTGVGGHAARNGLSGEVGPTAPNVLWQGSIPAIVAQQAVIEGDLVVVSRISNFNIPTGTFIVAHDLTTGEERWTRQLPYDFPGSSWRSRVTAVRDGLVYATRAGNTNSDYLYALDPTDGETVWRSEDLINEHSTESPAFADNGDIITSDSGLLLRISRVDGSTVWSAPRTCPTSNGCDAAVFGDRVYIWEAGPFGPVVTAFDIDDGEELYSSDAVSAGIVQQIGLMVGPDGVVYAPRAQNNPSTDFFVALEDTGTELIEKWRVPMGWVPFASFAVGPDGSVYTYSRNREVIRLDPETGEVLDTSIPIPSDGHGYRIAIDSTGKVYVTNGGFAQGALYAFNARLDLQWSEPLTGVNVGGPAMGENGTLIVCGTGTRVLAFRTVHGDADDDGDVDLDDFAQFISCVTGPGGMATAPCEVFDFNWDGDVDWPDFAILQRAFTAP